MASLFSTEGLSGASARRPWLIIAVWLVLLVAAGVYTASNLSGSVSTTIQFSTDIESAVGLEKIDDAGLSQQASIGETIVIASTGDATIDDAAFQERADAVVGEVRELLAEWRGAAGLEPEPQLGPGSVPNPLYYYDLREFGVAEVEQLVSEDRRHLIIPVSFLPDFIDEVEIGRLLETLETHNDDVFTVVTAGTLSINERYSLIAEEDLIQGELIGLPMALLVLVVVFGALVAPIIPILLAIFSIGIALGVVTVLGNVLDLNLFIQNMVTMLGLAVGIDYALFVVE